jgi:hypothetical protein
MPLDPPAPFTWHQRDACDLRCEACGEIVRAEVADLHLRTSPTCAPDDAVTNEVPRAMYGRGLKL